MLKLHARTGSKWSDEPLVLRVTTDINRALPYRGREAFLLRPACTSVPAGFQVYLAIDRPDPVASALPANERICTLPSSMAYLGDGDIVRISPTVGHLSVLYRRSSRFNALLLTERCNSNCIMCSQPPKDVQDDHLVDTYLAAIPLMDVATAELGITGGEPTLLGDRLLALLAACRDHLPNTAVHMLSNGRLFNYLSLCQELANVNHPDLVIGIPVYSDIASRHDFVVQAAGAFDQTLRGIMNLERCGLRVEVRVVLHQQTIGRLPQLARFIARNLPFVEHVALMGLEIMGYVRMNLDALWIDPVHYQRELAEAVQILDRHQMKVSIFNHQLCTLDKSLWPFARRSISDWKNEYLPECEPCAVRGECGGFFSSSVIRRSDHIHPLPSDASPERVVTRPLLPIPLPLK